MIHQQLTHQLDDLSDLLRRLSPAQYSRRILHLGDASIGGHTRHIIELIRCLTSVYEEGVIDYHNRQRNLELENNKQAALEQLEEERKNLVRGDKVLQLRLETGIAGEIISTTFFRELVYHTEHTIHHMALIKVALHEQQLQLTGENFGMAYSTIQYRALQAASV